MIPASLSSACQALVPALKNHLWQSTLFLLLAALLALVLRSNRARERYWLWMAASLKFLLPFALLATIGSHFARPRAVATAQPTVYFAVEDFSEPFALQPAPAAPVAAPADPFDSLAWSSLLPLLCAGVWLAGFIAVLAIWCVRWRRVARAMRAAVPFTAGREFDKLRQIEREVGLRRPIELRLSADSDSDFMEPGIFGIIRPMLAWPAGISQRLDDAHLDAILAHEVCHVRRRDNLTAAIHMLVEALFWFHPLVWWLGARLIEERERACDEEVLRLCNRPEVYAESILKVCEFCLESPLPCVSGVTGSDLKRRIADILAGRIALKLGLGRKLLLLAASLLVLAVPIVLAQARAAQRMRTAAVKVAPLTVQPRTMASATPIEIAQASAPPVSAAPAGQAALPEMKFDVAVIRPSPSDDNFMSPPHGTAESFNASMASVESMIGFAYGIPVILGMSVFPAHFFVPHPPNLIGGPAWVSNDCYDLTAKADEATVAAWSKLPRKEQTEELRSMMRALLSERFGLVMHHETRVLSVWALVEAKGGPKFGPSAGPPADLNDGEDPAKPFDSSKPYRTRWKQDYGMIQGQDVTMADFTEMLWSHREIESRKILDRTGLKGNYDLTLKWASVDDPRETNGPSIFTAIQEQLGLKLVSTKAPVDVVVIDHIDRPTPN